MRFLVGRRSKPFAKPLPMARSTGHPIQGAGIPRRILWNSRRDAVRVRWKVGVFQGKARSSGGLTWAGAPFGTGPLSAPGPLSGLLQTHWVSAGNQVGFIHTSPHAYPLQTTLVQEAWFGSTPPVLGVFHGKFGGLSAEKRGSFELLRLAARWWAGRRACCR